MFSFHKSATALLAVATLAGCASLSPDGNQTDINTLTAGKTAGINAPVGRGDSAETREEVARLLAGPLSAESAVRIALLNNPGIHASMAALGISDADRVRAGTLPNPHFSIGRFVEGRKVEIERGIGFSVIGLLTLPWRAKYQSQQHEVVKLQAAQEVVKLAADTRKAWITAVAAQQTASYMKDAKEAAEASGELARRLARVGNWSKLQQAQVQLAQSSAKMNVRRAQNAATQAEASLIKTLRLTGMHSAVALPDRLPDVPVQALSPQALDGRVAAIAAQLPRAEGMRNGANARLARQAYLSSHALAVSAREEVLKVREFITEETVLHYNGMLKSVWDLLGEVSSQSQAVASAIEAQRDFCIAETDLQWVLQGGAPDSFVSLGGGGGEPAAAAGH
ncbi:MAG: TolC family protein [Polaromonas sp.]|nr:TolC family protein [Polaromonas sp.]